MNPNVLRSILIIGTCKKVHAIFGKPLTGASGVQGFGLRF